MLARSIRLQEAYSPTKSFFSIFVKIIFIFEKNSDFPGWPELSTLRRIPRTAQDEPHTGIIGIAYMVSWYTFYRITFNFQVAVGFLGTQKVPNLQSIVLGQQNFPGHWALRVAPETPSPPILEKRAKVMESISRKLPKHVLIQSPITGKTP